MHCVRFSGRGLEYRLYTRQWIALLLLLTQGSGLLCCCCCYPLCSRGDESVPAPRHATKLSEELVFRRSRSVRAIIFFARSSPLCNRLLECTCLSCTWGFTPIPSPPCLLPVRFVWNMRQLDWTKRQQHVRRWGKDKKQASQVRMDTEMSLFLVFDCRICSWRFGGFVIPRALV